MRALVTGATGFVGGLLAERLAGDGVAVRRLQRRDSAPPEGQQVHVGDVLEPDSLRGAGEGVDVAYYLIHSMGRGADADFAERERRAARNFARMAREEGVGQVVYLGGLAEGASKHLRSRHETAQILADEGPPLTYVRAAMVVGSGSESFRTLYHLVKRLPVMVAPAWVRNRTQPIGIGDVLDYLGAVPRIAEARGREIQVGGADVMSYGEMLEETATALGRRKPRMVPVPLLTPALSSLWIGLVTPVDAGVARPLVEGLSTDTVVSDPSGARLFDIEPRPFAETVREALAT